MARWRLVAKHYLQVPGTEWEYKEVDRTTGRPRRKTFSVPLFLDPESQSDWTHRDGDLGEIIVAYEGSSDSRDIIFEGDPTPDMVPLDDEAKKISASFAAQWKHPIESLEGTYADTLLDKLQGEVADIRSRPTPAVEGMAELLAAMTGMMKQNQELIEMLAKRRA